MQKQTNADRLNRCADQFHLGLPASDEEAVCDVFDAHGEFPLSLIGEARHKFQSSVDNLLNSLSLVKGTVSREFVITELIPLIRNKKIAGEPFDHAEADQFKQKICNLPLQMYRVLRPINGIDGVRSAVVHSGKDSVDPKDLDSFIRICRHVVLHLVSGDEFKEIDSMAKLSEHFRLKKYSAFHKT